MNTAKEVIIKALDTMCPPVFSTLGVRGKTFLFNHNSGFEHYAGDPVITQDGATVIKNISSDNPYINNVMKIIREAVVKTATNSGDGTTSTTIIFNELVRKGFELNNTYSSREIINVLEEWQKELLMLIDKERKLIDRVEDDMLLNVASISSHDNEIGKQLYDIMQEIGLDGTIEVKEGYSDKTTISTVNGIKVFSGYLGTQQGVRFGDIDSNEEVLVVVLDFVINNVEQILPFIRIAKIENKPLAIFCQDIGAIALTHYKEFIKVNNSEVVLIQQEGFGQQRLDLLDDICVMTGGYLIEKNVSYGKSPADYTLENITELPIYKYIGRCKELVVTETETSIIGGFCDEKVAKEISEDLKLKLKGMKNDSFRDILFIRRRIANLNGGFSIIVVGGNTSAEIKELYYRYEDAVLALKSAINEGVMLGGGYTWLKFAGQCKGNNEIKKAFYNALLSIPKRLLVNSDKNLTNDYEEYVSKAKRGMYYDGKLEKFVKLNDYKVYDSAAVYKDVINNAVSIVKVLLSIEYMAHNGQILGS